MVVNGFGAVTTFVVMIVFGATKFKDGAWIVIVLTPILMAIFYSIHMHYRNLAHQLSLENLKIPVKRTRNRVIMPVSGVHRGTLAALRYAKQLSDDVTVIHISIDPIELKKVESKWAVWGEEFDWLF